MIKKLIVILLALFLFGCSEQSALIFQDEAEGSITKFDNDTHIKVWNYAYFS